MSYGRLNLAKEHEYFNEVAVQGIEIPFELSIALDIIVYLERPRDCAIEEHLLFVRNYPVMINLCGC